MPASTKKPIRQSPPTPADAKGGRYPRHPAPANPRIKPDTRWQRSKRYGWDSR